MMQTWRNRVNVTVDLSRYNKKTNTTESLQPQLHLFDSIFNGYLSNQFASLVGRFMLYSQYSQKVFFSFVTIVSYFILISNRIWGGL